MSIRFSTFACAAALFLTTLVVHATSFVVANVNDSGTGSLRQAILDANAAPGNDVITFNLASQSVRVVDLLSALPELASNIEILNDRPTDEMVTVQRSAAAGTPSFRVFKVNPGNTVVLAGLTISNGSATATFPENAGGGVRNDHATLVMRNCYVLGNTASRGGGIENDGSAAGTAHLTLLHCLLGNNVGSGGAVNNLGGNGTGGVATMTASRCTFSANKTYSSSGGAIYNLGLLGAAEVNLVECTFASNVAFNGSGGGIINVNGIVSLRNCTLSDNRGQGGGGGDSIANEGFFVNPAKVTLSSCTITAAPSSLNANIFNHGILELANTILRATGPTVYNSDIVNSLGHNLANDNAGGNLDGPGDISNTDPLLDPAGLQHNGGPTRTIALQGGSPAINTGNNALAPLRDQRGFFRADVADIGAFELNGTPMLSSTLGNISARARVATGDNVLIGGFIVTGTQPKKVIVRAIGPSLPVTGKLANPILELHGPNGVIASNDNWRSTQEAAIIATTIPPTNDLEAAIVATLPANNTGYTAIVRGVNNTTGVGLVEVYDLDPAADSRMANISARGRVQTGNDAMIGGFILTGPVVRKVIVRAIGPSLPLNGKLADPTLELFDQYGFMLGANDNWRTGGQEAEIIASTVPPSNDLESAIVLTLPASAQATAIVRGKNDMTGVGQVEVFSLD